MQKVARLIVSLPVMVALNCAPALAGEPTSFPEPLHQSLPAVDGVNAKLSFGGLADEVEGFGVTGAMTVPLGHRFGLQIDGAAVDIDTDLLGDVQVYGTAAHLFWRDPSKGLLGLYGDYIHVDTQNGIDFFTAGIEGAIYLDRFSIDGILGAKDSDITDIEFFNRARLLYYPIDNLSIHVGHTFAYDQHNLFYGGEWAFDGSAGVASSLFVLGELNESGDNVIAAGLRFYFSQNDKTLIRRHREDDPAGLLPVLLGPWAYDTPSDDIEGPTGEIFASNN